MFLIASPYGFPYGSHMNANVGPLWAAHIDPTSELQQGFIWVPYRQLIQVLHGQPILVSHVQCNRDSQGVIWAAHISSPLGVHMGCPCVTHMGFATGFHMHLTWAVPLELWIIYWLIVPFNDSMLMVVENVNIAYVQVTKMFDISHSYIPSCRYK